MPSAIVTQSPWPSWPSDVPWPPPHVMAGIGCDDRGLVVGVGTPLVRMDDNGRLAVEADAARCIALLSVLCRRPIAAEILRPIEAAAAYWAAGDKALANLRLVFAGLPKLASLADAQRLDAAAWCLDQGLAPRDLMKALDLDSSVLDLRKYDPDQPRVPAAGGARAGGGPMGPRMKRQMDVLFRPLRLHQLVSRQTVRSRRTASRRLPRNRLTLSILLISTPRRRHLRSSRQ